MKFKNPIFFTMFALAATNATADDIAVSIKRADLNHAMGVQAVHEQILEAARAECPSYSQVRSLPDIRSCRDRVAAALVAQVSDANLTAYHEHGDRSQQVVSR